MHTTVDVRGRGLTLGGLEVLEVEVHEEDGYVDGSVLLKASGDDEKDWAVAVEEIESDESESALNELLLQVTGVDMEVNGEGDDGNIQGDTVTVCWTANARSDSIIAWLMNRPQ